MFDTLSLSLVSGSHRDETPRTRLRHRREINNLTRSIVRFAQIYYEKKKQLKAKKNATKSKCDDGNYNYIIRENEILSDRYIVERRIGKGSFGQVVRALDRSTKNLVAIKIIKSRPAFTKQAQTEISVLKFLNGKDPEDRFFVVRLLDTFVHKHHTCLVFENLSYNLYDLLRNTNFHGVSLNLVRKFGVQILQSLRFLGAEKINVIHCDLKPENILLRHPRRSGVKVIDFGSSCYGDKPMYKYIQSRFYRSPEVILGLPYDVAIDIWSLGCVLVEMHTGEPLFNGTDEADQLRRIMEVLGPIPSTMLRDSTKILKLESRNKKLREYLEQQRKGTFVAKRTISDILGVNIGGPNGRRKGEAGHDKKAYETFADLASKLLRYDPGKDRSTALDALHHPFFSAHVTRTKSPGSSPMNTIETNSTRSLSESNQERTPSVQKRPASDPSHNSMDTTIDSSRVLKTSRVATTTTSSSGAEDTKASGSPRTEDSMDISDGDDEAEDKSASGSFPVPSS